MLKNITNVRGIKCWGAHTGVKSMRRDLAIIYSEVPASAAAVFTQNKVQAEPVKISKKNMEDGRVQAIIVNSGNANACTGQQGREGAEAMVSTAARELGIDENLVLVASTGVIGEPFPTEEIVKGIKENVSKLSSKSSAGSFCAHAILTTDTFAKEGFDEFEVDGYEVNIGAVAKGSGMIHPNMATMLAFIATDVAIDHKLLQKITEKAVDRSFNMITVDGVTSTNDMVAVMANGLAQNDIIRTEKDPGYNKFREKLEEMMIHLAKLIVSDGEGSSKFIEYEVVNAPSEKAARKLIRKVSESSLVKAAMYGRDPNWGRIICAAGNAGIAFNYEKADLFLGAEQKLIPVLDKGKPVEYDHKFMKNLLRESHLRVKLDLHSGRAGSKGWGTDLTPDYVLFNSIYHT